MEKEPNHGPKAAECLLALLLVGSLAGILWVTWAVPGAGIGQPAAPLPWKAAAGGSQNGQISVSAPIPAVYDPGPDATTETWTNPVFWMVVGLVVLGSLVLMADFPETQ